MKIELKNMKQKQIVLVIVLFTVFACSKRHFIQGNLLNEASNTEFIEQIIKIDSVWSGHPVDFCLYTHENKQYIAYYNANRNMVVGQRNIDDKNFKLYIMPPTSHETARGTSTTLGWDSHNYLTIGIDKDRFIHLSGNMHTNPITYFKSTKPNDISTLVQETKLVGTNEKLCTYPRFLLTKEGDLVFHYRDGISGNGNEIYNIYSCKTKKWSRMLDVPLTDGEGLSMNAYQSDPIIMEDGWYHVYWVWRDTPDCSTNHDLSYMKSPDLKNWYNAFGEKVELPATLDKKRLIVDPIPVKGGIINLAAKLCLDENKKPVFTYQKYDSVGNLQLYIAYLNNNKWVYKQVSNWDYRWEFSGSGSINVEFQIRGFNRSDDGNFEIDYWHIKYGYGTFIIDKKFDKVEKLAKSKPFSSGIKPEGNFPGLKVRTDDDIGDTNEKDTRYILKWETIDQNRDKPQPKPWPKPSQLYLYKLKKTKAK